MTPPSPSSTRPYTRATASAIAKGKRRAVDDSDDEHDADNYFQTQHENHSPNARRVDSRPNQDESITDSTQENTESEDVEMAPVRLTMDESDEGILEQPATSSTSNDHDGSAETVNVQSNSGLDSACGDKCSKGYDLRSNHFGRGKENIPPLEEGGDWHMAHERSHDIDEHGRLLSTPGAGPSGSQSRDGAEAPVQSDGERDGDAGATVDNSSLRHNLRRSRTMIELPTPLEPSSPHATTPTIEISSADPPALSTRARSTRRTTRATRRGTDEQILEDTDREDEADGAEVSSSTGRVQEVLGSDASGNAPSSSRKRRCIRSSASLQVPISTSSAANRPSLSRSRPSLSASSSVSSFQIPTLRSATPNNANTNNSASSSRRVTRTASSPNIARSATFSGSSTSNSTAMYSMSCAANKRRLSNGPNSQASSFGMGLAELAKATGSGGSGSSRAEKGRKREMSVSSVRSEASISAISTTSYASYSVTSSSAPSTAQAAAFDPDSIKAPRSSAQSTRPSMSTKPTDRKEVAQAPVNRQLFGRPDSARSEPTAQSSEVTDIAAVANVGAERFTLARTDTSASTASSSGLLSSSPTSDMSGGFLFPATPTDEVMSSPMRPLSRLHSDDLNLLGDLALTPKRARRAHASASQTQTPDLTRSPSTSTRSEMDAVLDTPPSLVSSTFATPKANAEQSMSGIEVEMVDDEVATPNARRQYTDGYKALKAALKCSSSGNDGLGADRPDGSHTIIGREEEKALIQKYLLTGVCDVTDEEKRDEGRRGLYISGPPGTGKTATVSALIAEHGPGCKVAFVNCMGLVGRKEEIWFRIADAWGFVGERQAKEKPERLTEKGLSKAPAGSKFILVLDEVDALLPSKACSTSNQILRALFTLPHPPAGLDLKLIAIANSLDLTVRKSVASVLGSHAPFNLTFKAYGAKEMTDIIKRRVQDCNEALKINCPGVLPANVDDKAIELVGRKVEANNGDLRMCLGVLVEAVNAAEGDWRKKAAAAGTGARIPPFKISLSHVLKALSSYNKLKANAAATSTSSNASGSSLHNKVQSLNVQVRMILLAWLISKQRLSLGLRPAHVQSQSASFASCSSTSSSDTVSTEALYPTYTYVLSSASSPFPPASQPDFMDLLMQAEVLGLLSVEGGDGLTPSKSKARRGRAKERVVELLVKEEELKTALGIRKDAESENAIAMDSEIRAIWHREEKRWQNSVAGRQRALDSARRHTENGTAGFNEEE